MYAYMHACMCSWYTCRLYTEVQVSNAIYTTEGRKARGCVNHVNRVETEPSDLYHGLRGPDNASSW